MIFLYLSLNSTVVGIITQPKGQCECACENPLLVLLHPWNQSFCATEYLRIKSHLAIVPDWLHGDKDRCPGLSSAMSQFILLLLLLRQRWLNEDWIVVWLVGPNPKWCCCTWCEVPLFVYQVSLSCLAPIYLPNGSRRCDDATMSIVDRPLLALSLFWAQGTTQYA